MGARHTILVVDDEEDLRRAVAEALTAAGPYECVQARDGAQAFALVQAGAVNLVLTDLKMPGMGGGELLAAVRGFNPEIPVIVMTGFGTVENAVELMKSGAYDYITKPFKVEELSSRVGRALERLSLIEEIKSLRSAIEEKAGNVGLIGGSPAMLRILRQLSSIARAEAAVILYGESGTGKEVVARAVHGLSPRAQRPFVTVHCGALPESLLENELFGHVRGAFTDARENYGGLIREADGGTLFLDEIGEITLATQVKLLRFLQEKEYRPLGSTRVQRVDARIVTATNRDLKKALAAGTFREDLFYRLNILPLTLPPLRERKEDIPLLANHFLERLAREMKSPVESISPLAMQKLMSYDWPGNVRELENKVQQVVALSTTNVILPEKVDLPAGESISRPDGRLKSYKEAKREVVTAFEVSYVSKLLAMTGGNISEAARLARKHRRAFWEIMQKHEIKGRLQAAREEREQREVELVG